MLRLSSATGPSTQLWRKMFDLFVFFLCVFFSFFLFAVSKDEWDTKEDTGKSMKNAYCGMPKGTTRAEVTSNSEKIKPVA